MSSRRLHRTVLLVTLLAVVRYAGAALGATVSGRLTDSATGAAIGGATVSATRTIAVGPGGPDDPIVVEWDATTDADGVYSITVNDALPGLAAVLVFTRDTLHYNQLDGGVETSAHTPRVADVGKPGVLTRDLRSNVSGVNFSLASNRDTFTVLMRDGSTHLSTAVWRPARVGQWPVILMRTPYDKEGLPREPHDLFIPNDFAVVGQDIRGQHASEGLFKPYCDEGWGEHQDGYDTIEWIAAQSWSNGHVGTFGRSAAGVVQYFAAGAAPAHLDCAWVATAMPNAYHQEVFQGGGYRAELVDRWLDDQGASYMKEEYRQHPNYDSYWDQQNLFTRLTETRTPIYHVGGWYDIFDEGSLLAFRRLQLEAATGAKWNQKLRMGPWTHRTYGGNVAGQAVYPLNSVDKMGVDIIRWFDFWMKGKETGIMDEPPVRTYVMGPEGLDQTAVGNYWRQSAGWPPPATPRKYYLQGGGGLSTTMPAGAGGADGFTYNPLSPVPTVGGPNLNIAAGPYDQRTIETRADVLTFSTGTFGAPLEITGSVTAHLFASSSATDTDWTVKLVDVYPDGRALSVTDGVLRARHYLSFESESLLVPGQIYEFVVDLWSTSLIFDVGHRVRIEVASSNSPRFDRNPNTGHPFRADLETLSAANTIYRDAAHASYLLLPVVDGSTAAGCATTASISELRLARAPNGQIQFQWNPVSGDGCFAEYRLFGADDPTSWAWFVRNPLARTTTPIATLSANSTFYLVVAAGTDGANGPHPSTP